MFPLHKFSVPSSSLDHVMREYRTVEKKARAYRRQLIATANRLRGEGKPCELVKACVTLAREMGRIERHATYMYRSALCQRYGCGYDLYRGDYKSYRS